MESDDFDSIQIRSVSGLSEASRFSGGDADVSGQLEHPEISENQPLEAMNDLPVVEEVVVPEESIEEARKKKSDSKSKKSQESEENNQSMNIDGNQPLEDLKEEHFEDEVMAPAMPTIREEITLIEDEVSDLMSSIVSDFDKERQDLILNEIDEFLREKKTIKELNQERQKRIDEIELNFMKFLRERQREMNIIEAREAIRDRILPKLKEVDDRILERKEKHLAHIKALRKYSTFQKSDLENFKNENYELKKNNLDLKTQIKLLKVELEKTKFSISPSNPRNKNGPIFHQKILKKEDKDTGNVNFQRASIRSHPLEIASRKMKKKRLATMLDSQSTRATNLSDIYYEKERYEQEIKQLKQLLNRKNNEYKISMSRMKKFYDETLKKLNKVSPPDHKNMNCIACEANQDSTKIPRHRIKPKTPIEEIQFLKSLLSKERLKITKLREINSKKDETIDELNKKILKLKKDLVKSEFGSLAKKIKRLEKVISNQSVQLEKMKEKDNLKYQIKTIYRENGDFIYSVINVTSRIAQLKSRPLKERVKRLKKVGRNIALGFFKQAFYPIYWLIQKFSSFVTAQFSNLTFNKKQFFTSKIKSWRSENNFLPKDYQLAMKEIKYLEHENNNLEEKLSKMTVELQRVKMNKIFDVDILGKKKKVIELIRIFAQLLIFYHFSRK